jgi:N-acetylglucosaminyldiphosphoundecaprenol N-acetyl-beta-D-mannosaminyltransferase
LTSAREQIRIGALWIDAITFPEALQSIDRLVDARNGGAIFTPNTDHVVLSTRDESVRRAYELADLVLVDGMPVLWASWLLGTALPQKISGSDLLVPLVERAGRQGWRVYLLGGGADSGVRSAEVFRSRFGVNVVGVDDAMIPDPLDAGANGDVLARIEQARPDLLIVSLGSPKQELWISCWKERLRPAVVIGVGAGLDFVAGRSSRSPRWMSAVGLEWLYRLAREPRRLWRRYLMRGPGIVPVVLRMARLPRTERVRRVGEAVQ